MKRPHRWAALLTALMMAMTLAITPREGVAGGGPYRPIDTSDPPVNLFGEPDFPPVSITVGGYELRLQVWSGCLLIAFVPSDIGLTRIRDDSREGLRRPHVARTSR